jgi:hypothetical protein
VTAAFIYRPAGARKYGTVTVEVQPGGWPGRLCTATGGRCSCRELPIWRSERRERGYSITGYWCDGHFRNQPYRDEPESRAHALALLHFEGRS